MASNRRSTPNINISLENILQFTTCATEEPILGFEIQPSIEFIIPPENQRVIEGHNTDETESESVNVQSQSSDVQDGKQQGSLESPEVPPQVFRYVPSFLPMAHTCINALQIPRPTYQFSLSPTEELYKLYDEAFAPFTLASNDN